MRHAAGAAVVLGALALAGCGSSGGGASGATTGAASPTTTHAATVTAKHRTAPAPLTGSYHGPVPILMYHVVTAPPAGTPYPQLWVPWKTFIETMLALKKAGYAGVTLEAVWKAWHGGPGLPKHPIVLTFDDGYPSQSQHARPTLRALGWPGVLFLEGKNIDPKVGLSRHEIRALMAAGWEIDAHTLTHPDLTTVGAAQLKEEVAGSRAKIRRIFHVPVDNFAYPAGKYDPTVEAAVKAAGFHTAVTVDGGVAGPSDDPYALPRIRVNGSDTAQDVVSRVNGLAR